MGTSDGTATTRQPAAVADATPLGESSSTTQPAGSASSSLTARRYGSGSGLVAVASSAQTVTGNVMPVAASTASANSRCDEVTSAYGSPAPATSASSSRAPGRTTTRPARVRASMPSIIQRATVSGAAGRVALASR